MDSYNYRIEKNLDKLLVGLSTILPVKDEKSKQLFAFYDTILENKSYKTLFASCQSDLGEWNLYAMNEETEGTGNYLYATAAEVNETMDLKRLHGLQVRFFHICSACWLVFRTANNVEAGAIHAQMVEGDSLKKLGYRLAYGKDSPIMEYQPQSCTQTPEYIELWIPVTPL